MHDRLGQCKQCQSKQCHSFLQYHLIVKNQSSSAKLLNFASMADFDAMAILTVEMPLMKEIVVSQKLDVSTYLAKVKRFSRNKYLYVWNHISP